MQQPGDYPGPSPDDYANVTALNTAFIRATLDLKGPQCGRLAAAPFLLFSLREHEPAWWEDALAEGRQGDLMDPFELQSLELRSLQIAALSFIWQLGRRNPYAVRIISGATIAWCERTTQLPLITLLNRVGTRGGLVQSRLKDVPGISSRLLSDGISADKVIRRSSHLAVLQTLLRQSGIENYSRLPAAACKMTGVMRVLDKKL
jgi:hypothetical protein